MKFCDTPLFIFLLRFRDLRDEPALSCVEMAYINITKGKEITYIANTPQTLL